MGGWRIAPEYPPLPTPSSLPFHASAGGIQTSNLMSESLVGRAVASTRQNAGSVIVVPVPLGGVKGPAGTAAADLIVTVGIVRAARLAHAVPPVAAPLADVTTSATVGISARTRPASRRRVIARASVGRDYTQQARIICARRRICSSGHRVF